ncbi:prepilin-type N-terminal cleavage/methylation domain-containing protein [Paenibacillus sp. OSY-SE]|uniref:prepilin-type N-terminal cleavage/methylation domain-containing protein n=1 Tax=Paenibacillus sp. OSY-SE TaxID=1196323 RepID=UPI00030A8F3B|nr:prepilin-type N-terminal cleavage/methylation domain-containing protein [Paenibacillus sp. OSY-SE]
MSMTWVQERVKAARNEKGMTLIELLAVIVILGIIIAIAAVVIIGQFDKAKTTSDDASMRIVTDAAQRYLLDHPDITINETDARAITMNQLITGGYIKEAPVNSIREELTGITVRYAGPNDKTLVIGWTGWSNTP